MPDVMQSPPHEPKQPKFVDYGRDAGALRRWARHTFTREKVASVLKTLAWVVPLTILVWVYAEREQLARTEDPIPIPIDVTSGDPTRLVTLLRPQERVILANLSGPRAELDAVRNLFVRSEGTDALTILIDRLQLSPGMHELRTVDLVRNQPIFLDRGVVVTNCQPATLQVRIDEYETRELVVEPPPEVTNLASPAVFEPARVRVRAPAREFNGAGEVRVYADLQSIPALATPGPHEVSSVRVYATNLETPHVTLSPPTVRATVEVRQADERYVVPFMAVYALMPAALTQQYQVDSRDTIPDVTLVGPPDKLAALKEPDYQGPRPYAAIEVTGDDRPAPGQDVGPVRTRRLKFFDLPDGVRVSSDDAQRTIDFKLVVRRAEN